MVDRELKSADPHPAASVSAVTVTYQTSPILYHAIDAVLRQPELKELIIVDNGNPERTVEALQDLAASDPRVKLLTGHGNIGFGAGCNLGAAQASGDYLLLINPDALLGPSACADMIREGAEVGTDIWMLGCNLLDPNGIEQRGARRGRLTPLTAFFEVFHFLTRFSDKLEGYRINRSYQPVKDRMEISVISGACMFLHRQQYEAINGMDEDYFLHVEDIDFCYRFIERGGHIFFSPNIRIIHHQGASRTTSNFIEWQKAKSFIIYFRKHFSSGLRRPLLWGLELAILARYGVLALRNFLLA